MRASGEEKNSFEMLNFSLESCFDYNGEMWQAGTRARWWVNNAAGRRNSDDDDGDGDCEEDVAMDEGGENGKSKVL